MERDGLEARVAALESQVGRLNERVRGSEQDAAAARVLAGAADRDVNEFRGELRDFRKATTAGFNAMREDFTDLRQEMNTRFDHVDRRFEQVGAGFEQIDAGFIEMRGKLDAAAAGQAHIAELLLRLIDEQKRP